MLNRNKNFIIVALVVLLGLGIGYSLGASVAEGRSFFNYFIRAEISVPGLKPDHSFVLGDFETGEALQAWKTTHAKMEIVPDHANSGRNSVKVSFFSHVKLTQIGMGDYFTNPNAVFDWSKFKALTFYIYNPQDDSKRVIVQISDRKRRFYKQDFTVGGKSGQIFSVPIERIALEINVKRINELSFFEWNSGNGFELYFDDVKLTA